MDPGSFGVSVAGQRNYLFFSAHLNDLNANVLHENSDVEKFKVSPFRQDFGHSRQVLKSHLPTQVATMTRLKVERTGGVKTPKTPTL